MRAILLDESDPTTVPADARPDLPAPYAALVRRALRPLTLDATAPLELSAEETALAREWLAELDAEACADDAHRARAAN